MHDHDVHPPPSGETKAKVCLEVGDIVRRFGQRFLATHPASSEQRKALWAIGHCRTAALGGHLSRCDDCGFEQPRYNSCRNRHCPKCQCIAQARWIEARLARLLPIPYFHVVFTLPAELRPLAMDDPKTIFGLLFGASAQALIALGRDPDRLGGLIGVTSVLHTWTRDLRFHPHVHCVVTGGGVSTDGKRWIAGSESYLVPGQVLVPLYRGKFLHGLDAAYRDGTLQLGSQAGYLRDHDAFARFKNELYGKDWVVYVKRPFGGPEQVFSYLGRYTHRVGISNQRLQAVGDDGIRFVTKGDATVTLSPVEFLRRLMVHVLPIKFHKIRHFGLHASSHVKRLLLRAREILLGAIEAATTQVRRDWVELFRELTGIDVTLCPSCKTGRMSPERSLPAIRNTS